MPHAQTHIPPQELAAIHRALGSNIGRATDILSNHINMISSPRDYAELREARSLVSSLKYPDPLEPVRRDELAWALQRVRQSYAAGDSLFEKAARLLGVDLDAACPIPSDLDRRIGNELDIVSRFKAPAPQLQDAF